MRVSGFRFAVPVPVFRKIYDMLETKVKNHSLTFPRRLMVRAVCEQTEVWASRPPLQGLWRASIQETRKQERAHGGCLGSGRR